MGPPQLRGGSQTRKPRGQGPYGYMSIIRYMINIRKKKLCISMQNGVDVTVYGSHISDAQGKRL
jgi:hypothetical protein